jgi:hypothetical protein
MVIYTIFMTGSKALVEGASMEFVKKITGFGDDITKILRWT